MLYDVAIIGAGVIGAHIARQLCRYQARVLLLEGSNDVAAGTTKANSAIVHAGYDAAPGSQKARFNLEGNRIMGEVCTELHVPFSRIGSLVVAYAPEEEETLLELQARGEKNGVPGLKILRGEELFALEPQLNKDACAALYAPTGGIVDPFELCFAAAENAAQNGVEFRRNFAVDALDYENGQFTLRAGDKAVQARYVVNAAGVHADEVARLAGDDSMHIIPRRGEYMLLDKSAGGLSHHVMFQCPSKMGKGVLVTPTVDGNILVGPSAQDIADKADLATTAEGLSQVFASARKTYPALSQRDIITSFSGLRAHSTKDDFIIGPSAANQRFYNVGGIESPGLTAAPAIGVYVADALAQLAGFAANTAFNPCRKKPVRFREMSNEERAQLLTEKPDYGRIVCRCETITEGEILDAIHARVGAVDIDGIKRRTRAGAGRCQGGFCGFRVLELLAQELDIPWEAVSKSGGRSKILVGRSK